MCEIGELTRPCGAAAPGITKHYMVDVADVISIPSANAQWTIVDDIILAEGKFWKDIPFVEQKSGLEDDLADAVGGGFKKTIPIKLSKYSPQSNNWINNAIGARFISALADNNGQMILVGDKIAPMRLEKAKGSTGQKSGDENGWDFSLVADGVKPCYFYNGVISLQTTVPLTFDTVLTFASSNEADAAGVGGTIAAGTTSSLLKFEFNAIPSPGGTPSAMSLRVSSAEQITIGFLGDYLSRPYRFTDLAGVVHIGEVFTGGIKNF